MSVIQGHLAKAATGPVRSRDSLARIAQLGSMALDFDTSVRCNSSTERSLLAPPHLLSSPQG